MLGRLARALDLHYLSGVRDRADAEAATERATSAAAVTRRMIIVLLAVMLCLTFVRFAGNENDTRWVGKALGALGLDDLAKRFTTAMTTSPDHRIHQRIHWAVARVVGYALLPLLVIRFALRDRPVAYGLRVRGVLGHAWVYLLLMAVLAPVVVLASYGAPFQAKYPYYRPLAGEALWPAFWAWEALYGLQFVALEFFFRGFFVHGLKSSLGYASIFVMMVPYTMIHFGKPLPEALGSIIAGFVLGTLSLKSGSVWGGAVIHIAVACSMDVLSLWHQGRL